VVGETRESGTRSITRDEMLDFATRYDPQWFHADADSARESIFGELVASGIHTAAIWRMLDHEIGKDIRWICGVAWEDVRWPHAVRAGDRVRARSEALAKRLSRSKPERGVVEYRYSLLNQRDELVFTCRSINLIEVRAPGVRT